MRKYQPIWEKLKESHAGSVRVSQAMHKRLITAVIKEKNQDIGFKLISQERGLTYKLAYTIKGDIVTFTLQDVSKPSISSL